MLKFMGFDRQALKLKPVIKKKIYKLIIKK